MRLIDADALEREGWSLSRTFQKDECTMVYEVKKPSDFPTIEERKEEIRKSWAIKELPSCSKMEQVEDCISRQAAIDAKGKRVLDPCCGSRMFWFDKENEDAVFCDIREVEHELIWASKDGTDKRYLTIAPNVKADVRHLPFEDESFYHIVFDPPHLQKIGDDAWLAKKYGKIGDDWQDFIHDAFAELFRVLKPNGTLIFKWAEIDIKLNEILKVIPYKPLYGHRSGKHMTTHWMAFLK